MKETFVIYLSVINIAIGSRCLFPSAWEGEYFHLGFPSPLVLAGGAISEKGRCVENFGSHYVMEEEEHGEKCWRCMTIFRKHHNVLQYKESYCETYFDTFQSLCENIAGDSPMYSMFRRSAEPERCPFRGPFTFSYSKGGSGLNTCASPRSYLDSCTDHHRLQLSFQACIDVQGSESGTEELQCLAHWREGSKHYLVAEMDTQHVYSDESKYRCFVYEKAGKGDNRTVQMAQSLSATCSGLWSPTEGYRTFALEKVAGPSASCLLPSFLTGRRSWSSLDGSVRLHPNSGGRSLRLRNTRDPLHPEDSHVSCHRAAALGRGQARVVTFVKSGCDSGFVCSLFVEEAPGVVTVQLGQKARLPAEACSPLYFSESVVKSVLVVARPPADRPAPPCPLSGRYLVSALPALAPPSPGPACPGPAALHLQSGCGAATLTVERSCPGKEAETARSEHSCSHHWAGPGGLTHVVLSSPASPRLLCLSYTEAGGWLSAHSCSPAGRGPGSHQFNISQASPCAQTLLSSSLSSSAAPHSPLPSLPSLLTLLALTLPTARAAPRVRLS